MSEHTKLTGRHYGLADLRHDSLRNTIGNRSLINAVVAMEGDDKNDIQSTNALSWTIDGRMYGHAAFDGENVTVTDAYEDQVIQQANETCYYTLCLDTAGAVTAYKGGPGKGLAPHPANLCCFCVIKVVTVAATFQLGVDDFDKAAVTSTFYNVACLPATAP